MVSVILPFVKIDNNLIFILESYIANGQGVELVLIRDGPLVESSPTLLNTFENLLGRCRINALNVVFCELPQNNGVGTARNTGIEKVTNPFFLFLDSDDFLFFDRLAQIDFTIFSDHPFVKFRSFQLREGSWTKARLARLAYSSFVVDTRWIKEQMVGISSFMCFCNSWAFNTHFVKTNLIYFDSNLPSHEDLAFVLNCFQRAKVQRVLECDQFVGVVQLKKSSRSGAVTSIHRNLKILQRHFGLWTGTGLLCLHLVAAINKRFVKA